MLRKLIKHELRATGRLMLPMIGLLFLTAFGGRVSTRLFMESDSRVLNIVGGIIIAAFVLVMLALCLMALGLMIQRFYKNLLQDEGYLMLTLPVSVHQQLWSKLIVSTLWFSLSFIAAMLAVFILAYEPEMKEQLIGGLRDIFALVPEYLGTGYVAQAALLCLELTAVLTAGTLCFCLHFYSALAIGHSFSGHKLLISVAAFFLLNLITNVINLLFTVLFGESGLAEGFISLGGTASLHAMLLGFLLYLVPFALALYFITAYFMKKRLNLD